jgi:hypothetical protein
MTAVVARAPVPHALDGPSLRSKRGVEHFRRPDGTRSRAIRRRGAPTSPPRAAITPDALNTGLRQCQSERHKHCSNRLNEGEQTRSGGDLLQIATGRFREAGESTVKNDTVGGALGKLRNAVGVRVQSPIWHQPVIDDPNRVDPRDVRAIPRSTARHMLSQDSSVRTAVLRCRSTSLTTGPMWRVLET